MPGTKPNSTPQRKRATGLLLAGLGCGEGLLHGRGKSPDALDEGGRGPQALIGFPFAVGEHAGAAYAVLRDPKNLGFRVFRADSGEPRNRRIEAVRGVVDVRFGEVAVTSGAGVEINRSTGDEILLQITMRLKHSGLLAVKCKVQWPKEVVP